MRAIVDRIGCKLNVFNEDGVCRRQWHPHELVDSQAGEA
jgi:hypothetical protein